VHLIKPRNTKAVHASYANTYRVSQEECAKLRESVPSVKVHRCNPKHLYLIYYVILSYIIYKYRLMVQDNISYKEPSLHSFFSYGFNRPLSKIYPLTTCFGSYVEPSSGHSRCSWINPFCNNGCVFVPLTCTYI
jgi:hypothetical protein